MNCRSVLMSTIIVWDFPRLWNLCQLFSTGEGVRIGCMKTVEHIGTDTSYICK